MKEKIISILNHMVQEVGAIGIKGYQETADGSFKLETQLSEYKHQTFLK